MRLFLIACLTALAFVCLSTLAHGEICTTCPNGTCPCLTTPFRTTIELPVTAEVAAGRGAGVQCSVFSVQGGRLKAALQRLLHRGRAGSIVASVLQRLPHRQRATGPGGSVQCSVFSVQSGRLKAAFERLLQRGRVGSIIATFETLRSKVYEGRPKLIGRLLARLRR
jgi:hypothetical protein